MHGTSIDHLVFCLTPFAYEEVVVPDSVVTLGLANLIGCYAVIIRFTTADVMFRVDGGNPTNLVGIPAYDGDQQTFSGKEALNLKMIRVGGTSGKARATFYR